MSGPVDVIVVGAGGSGLAAALSAAEEGLSVLVLEKCAAAGGTTGIAIGSFTANRTTFQQRRRIEDSLDDHSHDAGLFASPEIEACNRDDLRRYFLDEARATLLWLEKLGVRFHGPFPEPPNRVPRMHNVIPNARAYIVTLLSHLQRRGVEIRYNTRVCRLLREETRVVGVSVESGAGECECFARRGVVLAAGDYANSPELIARFKGEQFAGIEGINPHATGDGHRLVEQAGGELLNMPITYGPELRFVPPPPDRRSWLARLPAGGWFPRVAARLLPFTPRSLVRAVIKRLLVTWQHPENSLFEDGAILINSEGRRFCDESKSPEREIELSRQPDGHGYLLLDDRLCTLYSAWPRFLSTAPEIAYAYLDDYLRLRPDLCAQAASLDQLKHPAGPALTHLETTVREWNATASQPLTGARWVLLGPVKAWFTTTEGGAAVDSSLRVLDRTGEPIPNLYAVGQNGLGGMILWGHGLHIAWALTSGRLVGKVLARA